MYPLRWLKIQRRKLMRKARGVVEEARDTLLEVCDTNAEVEWNGAEAQEEFSNMYDLVDLLFTKILKESAYD